MSQEDLKGWEAQCLQESGELIDVARAALHAWETLDASDSKARMTANENAAQSSEATLHDTITIHRV